MKLLAIALTIALVFSGAATAASTTLDVRNISPSSSIQEVVLLDDVLLDVTRGGLNRVACIGVAIGLGLGGLVAGAVTGGVGWALAGAYAPAVGALLCSL